MPDSKKAIAPARRVKPGYTALGLMMEIPGNHFTLAEHYLEAANLLFEAPTKPVEEMLRAIPLYFCIAQAFELFLKSYLGAHGKGRSLKGWSQHDIAALLSSALELDLHLSKSTIEIVREVSEQHRGNELRFMDERCVIHMPPQRKMLASTEELRNAVVAAVRPFIRVRGRVEASASS
jgi:hypothetical protein